MSNTHHLVGAAAATLRQALDGEASVKLERKPGQPDGPAGLVLEIGSSVHRLPLRLWNAGSVRSENADAVWVLYRVPKRVAEHLRAEGQNFIDLKRGHVRIRRPGLVIDRTDLEIPRVPSRRRLANPFGDRASLVSRVLAESPGRVWGTRELAAAAGVSTMTASDVVRQLEAAGVLLVESRGRAKRILFKSVEDLIVVWSKYYRWTDNGATTYAAPMGDPRRFLGRLPTALHPFRWALTLQAGASLVAPMAEWSRVHVYLDIEDRDLPELAAAQDWIAAPDGRLVLMTPRYRQSLWYGVREIGELRVVSDVQLILDLWEYPDRGREQARHLLERRQR